MCVSLRQRRGAGGIERKRKNEKSQIINIYTRGRGGRVAGEKEITAEEGRKEWREERLTSEAAAGTFGTVYLFFPVSPVASLAAGVRTSGFAARAPCSSRVCVCEEGKDNKFSPYYPSLNERDEHIKARAPTDRLLPFLGRFVSVLMKLATMTMTAMIAGPLCSLQLL